MPPNAEHNWNKNQTYSHGVVCLGVNMFYLHFVVLYLLPIGGTAIKQKCSRAVINISQHRNVWTENILPPFWIVEQINPFRDKETILCCPAPRGIKNVYELLMNSWRKSCNIHDFITVVRIIWLRSIGMYCDPKLWIY